jgi:Dolichyl-phosphate-mannose-protein mannosyltransferase
VTRLAWGVVALIVVLRALAAFSLPLTGDEAYYWEWSRRLAFGYLDHPPGVAFTIAAFAPLGHAPGVVRLGFVLCGAVASLAVAACAIAISGDKRAGAVAAVCLTLAPLSSVAFGSASPDGPYLMCWALALWFAARAFRSNRPLDWFALGLATGGVLLSRVLGVALPFGILAYALASRRRELWSARAVPLACVTALACWSPFLWWNATHAWATFDFALHRLDQTHRFALPSLLVAQLIAYSPGIWCAVLAVAIRPRNALLAWTALPLFALVMLLSLVESVETYWIFGFFVSLCPMIGLAYVALAERAKRAWTWAAAAPAGLLLALLFAFSFAPLPVYRFALRETGAKLRNGGPFEIMTYQPLAQDAGRLAREHDAVVMTDGYGFSSVLDFDAGLPPVVIGYDWQGRQSHHWYSDAQRPPNGLFVDKEPLASRPDIARHLQRACAHVVDGGPHAYSFGGADPRTYYFTWCQGFAPDGLAILRWEREPPGA